VGIAHANLHERSPQTNNNDTTYPHPMPQSLSLVLIHIVFATKNRTPALTKDISIELYPYLAALARNEDCECYRAGGASDHIHLAIRLSRTRTIASLVEHLKTESSKWLKTKSLTTFAWQRGYATFSVAPAHLDALLHYIDTQEKHHQKHNFQDELRRLLRQYGIDHDERYMWD
jgi:putative transposase